MSLCFFGTERFRPVLFGAARVTARTFVGGNYPLAYGNLSPHPKNTPIAQRTKLYMTKSAISRPFPNFFMLFLKN
ncbi:hypothetical protein HMPREF3293_00644 [Christensenella minuta]|uniref:Uncharacterized protein n=1 Tax=Christensenella minuta TaxID=626937 RepID=A0A136Q7E6_9FIRM|nr:hypothetical protein HMPREF3293_00644 [Christensenella minuta]